MESLCNAINNASKLEVEVIVVVNRSDDASDKIIEQNRISIESFSKFRDEHIIPNIGFYLIESILPNKHAGVGLARKIGMDEAVYRFSKTDNDGLIVCLDADCEVDDNYFEVLDSKTLDNGINGISIYFEHDLYGNEFEAGIYTSIIKYELFLRYYKNALEYCQLPYAFYTVGSSMAVRASAYAKQGGMNRRRAGEDFYFLQKIIELGNCIELNETVVRPSPRISDRVPFGTGKAVNDLVGASAYYVCAFDAFLEIRSFIEKMDSFFESDPVKDKRYSNFHDFLLQRGLSDALATIRSNVSSIAQFRKRFFRWLNAFIIMKFTNHYRENIRAEKIEDAARLLLKELSRIDDSKEAIPLLMHYRRIDKR
ncbi:MAG: hypothetical protein MRY83_06575 [Flavobacteriales bacterium]|nr:hypothetical protein [Flavobacteriales bacterium]